MIGPSQLVDAWFCGVYFSYIMANSFLVVEEAGENHRPWASNW
jgi:hypothetical protein